MNAAILIGSRFFKINGGETVVEAQPSGNWIRWDRWDGPVATSVWSLESPGLVEIAEDEAKSMIRGNH